MIDSPARSDWMRADGTYGTELADMQKHLFEGEGVTTAILNGFFYPSTMVGNYEFATALASAYNDWQIAEWLDKDPRLRGSIQVVAQDPQAAANEIDRVAAHPQIVQVFLPLVAERQYGDPYYWPIFEAATRNRLAVTMHHSGATKTLFGYPRYWIEWHMFAAPSSSAAQAWSLICNGVFDKFPHLRVVFLETGVAWVPWFIWRADAQYRELRVEIPWVKRLPSEHMRDCIRFATQPLGDMKPKDFAKLVEMSDSERMFLFATDYPHFDADSAAAALPGSLPENLRNRIRYQNAIETFPRLSGLAE
jgi:predicted TIM-barrel fold metal-dependent hydrolase